MCVCILIIMYMYVYIYVRIYVCVWNAINHLQVISMEKMGSKANGSWGSASRSTSDPSLS